MIEITVRTLDSQNHKFSVEDGYSVLEFKQHIASTVNIPAETQRIIYCGRVLADDAKLVDLNVNGKVVHLVERAPPSDNQNDQQNRHPNIHMQGNQPRVLGGNAMYLGSMAFEPQNFVPPPPTFRLAASRLNVARRMLRRAEATITLLENPSARPAANPPNDDVQVEVTPVFEARVIVPASSGENIDQTLMNAVHSSLLSNAANIPGSAQANQSTENTSTQDASAETEPTASAGSTPEAASTPMSTSTEDLSNQPSTNNQGTNTAAQENISRTTEMAELLETLTRLQARFAPFLERYQTFMRDDPVVEADDVRAIDHTFHRVSEVLHYFSHAYHSLSDMILRVRSAPPRRLVCRPILIQQTAVVPAGFPIQVEAQINFSADGPPNSTSPTSGTQTQPPSENARPGTTNTSTNTTPGNATRTSGRLPYSHIEFMNVPYTLPQGSVHVQTIPIGVRHVRSLSRHAAANAQTTTAPTNPSTPAPPNMPPPPANPSTPAPPNPVPSNANASNVTNQGNNQPFNNPNVEFFMEVTPGSITIDSLELGNQTDANRTATVAPTPDFIQSIMQMAGQLVNRGASTSNISYNQFPAPMSQPQATTPSTGQQTGQAQQPSTPGQNSQARGNTQTNPTTATHTRSTARPHVHFAQHAIQGFDPFLPCNSHHIMHLRRQGARNSANNNQNQSNNNNVRPQNGNVPHNLINPFVQGMVHGVLSNLHNMYGRRIGSAQTTDPPAPTAATALSNNAPTAPPAGGNVDPNIQMLQRSLLTLPESWVPQIPLLQNMELGTRGPTIWQLLQQEGDGDRVIGEGIFNDIVVLLSRHFTISDLVQLNAGSIEPLLRIRNEIRAFVNERIMEGNPSTPQNMDRAINKFLDEMQPFLNHCATLNVQNDIDVVRSTQMLFRTRLPTLINLAISRRPNALRSLMDQVKLLGQHLGALYIHAFGPGPLAMEAIVNRLLGHYMEGLSPELQHWTRLVTRVQLQQFTRNVNVPFSALQPYIVRNVDSVTNVSTESQEASEAMKVEAADQINEQESVANVLGVIDIGDGDDIPPVVLGSDSWHGQVPPDWVPIIARDAQRQRRQSQAPLSDGYLSGMPNKRRKVVTNAKPQGSLSQVISESMRKAVTTTGLASVTNLDIVAEEAGADLSIQSAYRDLLRSRVQSSIQDNQDFTAERFPNASLYFSKSQ